MKTKLSLLLLGLLYACVGYSQSDTTIHYNIAVNDTFQIKLKTNSDGGYSWQWVNKSEVNAVNIIRTEVVGEQLPVGWVGGTDTTVITGKGIKTGTDTLKLVYGRSWEKAPMDTAYIIVKVKNSTINQEIALNDTFQIKLATCFSCGYEWQWVNKSEVSVVDTTRTLWAEYSAEGLIGGPGSTDITFKGIKTGTDTLKLVYGRCWEKTVPKDTTYLIVTVKDTTAQTTGSSIIIYPNPVKNSLNLDLNSNFTKYSCEIYNSNGDKISTTVCSSPKSSINLSGYSKGCYILIVRQGDKKIYQTRFLKQ